MAFLLRDCNAILPDLLVEELPPAFAGGVGDYMRIQGSAGTCFLIVEENADPPPYAFFTVIDNVAYSSCAECVAAEEQGCTDPLSCNYDACANYDDGSCWYANIDLKVNCDDTLDYCGIAPLP